MKRAILLQTNSLTKSKQKILKKFSQDALNLANNLLGKRKSKRLMDLHKNTYLDSKMSTSFNSQVICDVERNVVKIKGSKIKHITVKFNIPRNCKTFNTKTQFFIELGMYPRKRIAVPIKQNKNYNRYSSLINNGWMCKTYGLTSDGQIIAFLSKEDTIFPKRENVLGVDINSKCFAVSIVTPNGRVLKQTYFGKDIWVRHKKIFERREKLQSLADKGNHRATQSIKKLKREEYNFVKNRLGEIVKEITDMALKYNADISIENLKRFNPKGKQFNKEVMRIPFYKFKQLLISRCFDKQIKVNVVDSWHTSKWCSHCGAVGKGHNGANYSIFKCKECGQIVNSDRKASLSIAVKSLLERKKSSFQDITSERFFFQFSHKQVPVSGLMRSNDGFETCAVHNVSTPMESFAL
ncbi:MAG: transposase [Thermoplasmatales archaeon]|nr:transposase [Thermoplasmatales archaeon]